MQGRSDVLGEPLEALASRWLAGPQRPCVCQNHVSDASIVCAGPTCLASPRRCCLRRTHVCLSGSTKALCAPDPCAWRVHRGLVCAGSTCMAGPQQHSPRRAHVPGGSTLALCAPEPGAWLVHKAFSSTETRRLAGPQCRLGCQIHMPDGFTRLFSWIHCVPWRLHHLALSLLGLLDPQDDNISNGNHR